MSEDDRPNTLPEPGAGAPGPSERPWPYLHLLWFLAAALALAAAGIDYYKTGALNLVMLLPPALLIGMGVVSRGSRRRTGRPPAP
jgi:hypothetical protein